MLSDWELWACAADIERRHAERAAIVVAERIGALVLAGDAVGVETWKAIAVRLQDLRRHAEYPS